MFRTVCVNRYPRFLSVRGVSAILRIFEQNERCEWISAIETQYIRLLLRLIPFLTCTQMASVMSMTFASAQHGLKPADVGTPRGPMISTPLTKPFGAQRRAMHTLAASFDSPRPSSQLDSAANFVRPDCPPISDDEGSSSDGGFAFEGSSPAKQQQSYPGKPKFRSALEQVCGGAIRQCLPSCAPCPPSPAAV